LSKDIRRPEKVTHKATARYGTGLFVGVFPRALEKKKEKSRQEEGG